MKNPYKAQSKLNPQKEDGHREICNPVFQALIEANLPGGELRVALSVIDRTWGYGKPSAHISLSHFEVATSLSRQGVIAAIKGAEAKHVIAVYRNTPGKPNEYMFNKHIDTWVASQADLTSLVPKVVKQTLPEVVNQTLLDWSSAVDQGSQVGVPSVEATKENSKETKKETKKERDLLLNENRIKVFEGLKERRGYNSPAADAEAKAITWMLKQGYTVEQILAAHDQLKKQPFWANKFLNMQSLKAQIGEVIKSGKTGGHPGQVKSYKGSIGKPIV